MAETSPAVSQDARLRAQIFIQGAMLQVIQKASGVEAEGLEVLLASTGLSQTDIGLVVGKSQSTVSRILLDAKKGK